MVRQESSGNFNHVGLPFLAESNLKHHKIVELICSLKDRDYSIDAASVASCPPSILQADHVAHMVLVIDVKVIIQVILETANVDEHYIAWLHQCDLLFSQGLCFSCCASNRI